MFIFLIVRILAFFLKEDNLYIECFYGIRRYFETVSHYLVDAILLPVSIVDWGYEIYH